MKQILGGPILTPTGWLQEGSILVEKNTIVDVLGSAQHIEGAEVVDAQGQHIVPGGIDLHFHGGGGADFQETTPEAFHTVLETHHRHGTTAFLPTLASSSREMIEAAAQTCQRLMETDPSILGLHLEGPYLNPAMTGGQDPRYVRLPDPDEYRELIDRYPCIRRWDAAPELPGAMEFGRYASDHGILVGLAHTQADYDTVSQAYDHGYTHATHFYNAMTAVHKRGMYKSEGTVEAVYLIPDMTVEVIADGIHVPPAILRLIHSIKGTERTCLVTDAMACTDSDSTQAFDPRVVIENGVCILSDHSALAGSIATMDRLLRSMTQQAGIPLEDAVRMTSETPACLLGIGSRKGSIQPGKDADIIFVP